MLAITQTQRSWPREGTGGIGSARSRKTGSWNVDNDSRGAVHKCPQDASLLSLQGTKSFKRIIFVVSFLFDVRDERCSCVQGITNGSLTSLRRPARNRSVSKDKDKHLLIVTLETIFFWRTFYNKPFSSIWIAKFYFSLASRKSLPLSKR